MLTMNSVTGILFPNVRESLPPSAIVSIKQTIIVYSIYLSEIMTKTNIPEKGAIIQRDMETFSIAPHIAGGFADPALLRKIADVAEKYGAKYVKLTGAQRIAIIGIKEDDLDKAWAEFADRSKAIGLTVRSIHICPGTRACKKAKQLASMSKTGLRASLPPT